MEMGLPWTGAGAARPFRRLTVKFTEAMPARRGVRSVTGPQSRAGCFSTRGAQPKTLRADAGPKQGRASSLSRNAGGSNGYSQPGRVIRPRPDSVQFDPQTIIRSFPLAHAGGKRGIQEQLARILASVALGHRFREDERTRRPDPISSESAVTAKKSSGLNRPTTWRD
jgi:hypothetical protein